MKFEFKKGAWDRNSLLPAYSLRFDATPEFEQHEDYIENPAEPTSKDGYSYISLVTKEKVAPTIRLSTRFSFEGSAAPLVVLPKKLIEKDGKYRYGDYLEVVVWKNGVNVWNLWQHEDGTVKFHNLLRLEEKLEPGVIHQLDLEIRKEHFVIVMDGHRLTLRCAAIYPEFHLGITGCEGPCRFYDMEITTPQE